MLKKYLGRFFGCPYQSNGIKTCLGSLVRNESNLSEFLSSPFLLQCQCQWETYQCHWLLGKMHHWHWKKKRVFAGKQASGTVWKNFFFTGTVSLLNMCTGEENQSQLKTDKELQVLGNDTWKNRWKKISLLV